MKVSILKTKVSGVVLSLASMALVGAGVWLAVNASDQAHAQDDPCADAAAFSELSVENLHSWPGTSGQLALTWYGPGVVADAASDGGIDDSGAGCTWRTQEDYDAAARNHEHQSLSLRYVVTRKVDGDADYETVSSQFHAYHSDGFGEHPPQAWVDQDPPDGRVTYRVQAALGQERSRAAVVVRQIGPVAELEPADNSIEETAAGSADPPEAVLCFYQWQGEVHSMSMSECSASELQRHWNAAQ